MRRTLLPPVLPGRRPGSPDRRNWFAHVSAAPLCRRSAQVRFPAAWARRETTRSAGSSTLHLTPQATAASPDHWPPLPRRSTDTAHDCAQENRAAGKTSETTAFPALESPETPDETTHANRPAGHPV